jgi:hypothetical protein
LNIVQWRCRPEGLSQGPIMLPVYQVEWRGSLPKSPRSAAGVPVVTLTILGTTKELTEFHVLDDSLFLRPRITIGGQARLCAMPDAEFQSLDALQRSNLVFQCTTATPETNSPPSTRPNEHGPQ